jgi:hypothetical protein
VSWVELMQIPDIHYRRMVDKACLKAVWAPPAALASIPLCRFRFEPVRD